MFLEQALTGPEGTSLSPVTSGIDMAKAMNLRPIYFDFREHKIRSDAAGELDLVAQVMRLDPSIRIDLRSHTDSRASTEYNDALSQRRANSTRQYLIEQGIGGDRISAKGYGERQLINACVEGMECSEEDHQLNRRTEFIITGCKDCGSAVQDLRR
jgi:outer membrane protein OmpA-like peptidoglycan-associated protein